MATPDFVVIGHVVRDMVPQGWRVGGTAAYAAVQAQRLGLRAGVVTRVGGDMDVRAELPGIAVEGRGAACTTTFENVYEQEKRSQRVLARADDVSIDDIPPAWRSVPMMLVGPVCGEVAPGFGAGLSSEVLGVSAQGWLRRIDRRQRVRRSSWRGEAFWLGAEVLFVSDEDLGRNRKPVARWTSDVPIVALTRDRHGARVHADGRWWKIAAFPSREVDPTGAGDVFAAAFLVRYRETKDVGQSARFASAAAACSIEGGGIEAIADRDQIEGLLAAHPDVVLR